MGWLFYILLLVCCFNVRADEAQTEAEINDLTQKLEKVESGLNTYTPSIEILVKTHFKDFRPIEIKTDAQVPKVHTDCRAAYEAGWVKSGVYRISPDGEHEMDVVCEQEEHRGGWTVLQRRFDGTVNFHRSWDDYKNGFGNLDGEFWIGNQNINAMTENRKQTLRVELQYEGEGFFHVDYSTFWVSDEGSKFKLHVAEFAAEDDITGDSLSYHNEKLFSTKNMDNDNDCTNCAQLHRGGWWYDNCTKSNLNGVYGGQSHNGIFWKSWGGFANSLISVRMMVRGEENDGDKATTSTTTQLTTGTTELTTEPPTTSTAIPTTTTSNQTGKNCKDIYNTGGTTSGVYSIYPDGKEEVRVFCEQELQDRGWTVFQRRINGSENFYRGWNEYKEGFGRAAAEYWIGNEHLHQLTANQDAQLLVELEYGGNTAYARYEQFSVGNETSKYKLQVGGFSDGRNNPGDSLAGTHNGLPFSTHDRDNDRSVHNCAQLYSGAWWYGSCSDSHLNGPYKTGRGVGIIWYSWKSLNSLTGVRMMVKTK